MSLSSRRQSRWRHCFCTNFTKKLERNLLQGLDFPVEKYNGPSNEYVPKLPECGIEDLEVRRDGRKLISTLNSNRLAKILQNNGINVVNKPVIELVAKPENWPNSFIDESQPRSSWPYLVLTSPFAARCAIEVAKQNNDLKNSVVSYW